MNYRNPSNKQRKYSGIVQLEGFPRISFKRREKPHREKTGKTTTRVFPFPLANWTCLMATVPSDLVIRVHIKMVIG